MSGRYLGSLFLLAGMLCGSAHAQSMQADASRPWRWDVSAYMLGAGMDGKVGVEPLIADVDESFSDILSNLQFGFMGRARATHGVWSFGTDVIYMGLGGDSQQPNAAVNIDQWAVELNVGFQLAPIFMSLVGARYNQLSSSIDFQTIGRSRSGKIDWWDPIIGGILTLPIGERWNFQFHGDIGGFGVGSDLAWQIEMLFNWFATPRTSVMMGYRWISTDYDDNGFVYDVVSQGPQLGVTLHF
ncbi:MAG TPA: hypothetical protein VEZ88_02405 [Steroidobacteraceae bacterium]|nr:hypothetical protein [Steroidobacteraceae bacterium]